MKKFAFAAVLLMLSAGSAFASLPPLYQSLRELQALLTSEGLQESLGSGEVIQEIVRTAQGYVVTTQNYHLTVDVQYAHPGKIGPAEFDFQFHPPIRAE